MNKISKFDTLKNFSDCLDNSGWSWHYGLFEIFGIWHWDVDGSDSFYWGIQMEKGVSLMNTSCDFSSNSAGWEAVLNSDQSVGLLDAVDDCFSIEGFDCSQVDDLTADSLFGELLGGLEGVLYVSRVSDKSDVLAFSHDLCLSDWDDEVFVQCVVFDFEFFSVQVFVFQENNNFV